MPERELVEQLNQAIDSLLAGGGVDAGGMEGLTAIAAGLLDLPSEDFKNRLKAELQRRTSVTASSPIMTGLRAGFRTITPCRIHSNAPAVVEFLKTTFGAEELKRNTAGEAYGFYSEVR